MSALRPAHLPRAAGLTTENVAHRFGVEWDDEQGSHTGVYVPRRDTDSRITSALGARIFPGAYHILTNTGSTDSGSMSIDLVQPRLLTKAAHRALSVTALELDHLDRRRGSG